MRAKVSALIATALLAAGCTPAVLRDHSVSLAGAGSDLRYREVIENLAMISANPWTLPAYSSIYSGAMDVTDSVAASETTTWIHGIPGTPPVPSGFSSQALDIPASRAVKGTLTLDPTIAPEKLRALRAACQWAVLGDVPEIADANMLKTFKPWFPPGNYFGVADELREISAVNWLGRSDCSRDVPKSACYRAHCGRAYVWVCPEGMENFTRFVLVCQKIARFDLTQLWKPQINTKAVLWSANDLNNPRVQSVTLYVDSLGNLALTQNQPANPPKTRNDNVGQFSDLKASINSVLKSP